MSDGLKASSGCEMGSLWGVLIGFKTGAFTGLVAEAAPGTLPALPPKSFDSPNGAPVLGIGCCPTAAQRRRAILPSGINLGGSPD